MTPGDHKATIVQNDIRAAGSGTEFVYVLLDIEGEPIAAQIWLTKKAMNMARAQLRACGFDPASEPLARLKENRSHLAGRKVDVEVAPEEYKGQVSLKARIKTSDVTKARIEELQAAMMAKGDPGDETDDIPF